jgi:hypothetical protein
MIAARASALVRAAAAAGLVALAGCGDLLQEPESGTFPLALEVVEVSGNGQEGAAGATLAEPVRVRTVHEGQPAGRLWVEWSVVSGGGSIEPRNGFSGVDGIAEARWTLGPSGGTQRLRARVGSDSEVVFEATAE